MGRILCCALFAVLISGCTASILLENSVTLPQLIEQTPLLSHPDMMHGGNCSVDVQILISADGTVHQVLLLNSSSDAEWDSSTVSRIRSWKYSPALYHGNPVRLWIRQRISIKYDDIVPLILAEIVCDNPAAADSVHRLLTEGFDFGEAAKKYSVAVSGKDEGTLGEVDGRKYPEHIQRALKRLNKGDYTKPLLLGQKYVILKKIF